MFRTYLYLLATDRKKGFIAGIVKVLLFVLSLVYGLAVKVLSFLYRLKPYRLNCKVISVGNITLGGTGKTSLVEFLSRLLRDKGHKVAVLSRGYRKPNIQYPISNIQYETMGDEPYMLSKNLSGIPVIVDKDRIRAARKAIRNYQVDTVILDDSLQQWRINKDLEIVTIDATNPLGNMRLIPRGLLREPLSSLRRAQIFLLTKVNLNPDNQKIKRFLKKINPQALIAEAVHKPIGFYKLGSSNNSLLGVDEFRGQRVSLACGIADPKSFQDLIRDLGIEIGLSFAFPDHHLYTKKDLDMIISNSQQKGINKIITTEKDSVRLLTVDYRLCLPAGEAGTVDCYVLRIKLELLQYETFLNRILSLY